MIALPETAPIVRAPLPFRRPLGRTGLNVSCLGIGGGGGASSEDVLHGYERGINYLFYSSDLHHFLYAKMAGAVRTLCGRGAAERANVVLGVATYVKRPHMVMAALFDQFSELGIDYVDVFFWGWLESSDAATARELFAMSPHLRGPGSRATQFVEEMFGVSERLKAMGAVRYVGASFHDVELAARWADSPLLDVVMVRHNVAHRAAQRHLIPALPPDAVRPGVVTFKSTYAAGGPLWKAPPGLPPDAWVPEPGDLYRYSLSQPCVDVCLTGPRRRSDIDQAIDAVGRGALTESERAYLAWYGDRARAAHAVPAGAPSLGAEPARHDARPVSMT